eukprot:scaffold104375_cov33-Phaeocystis_antarctica.AAC.1
MVVRAAAAFAIRRGTRHASAVLAPRLATPATPPAPSAPPRALPGLCGARRTCARVWALRSRRLRPGRMAAPHGRTAASHWAVSGSRAQQRLVPSARRS